MTEKQTARYGEWHSALDAAQIAGSALRLSGLCVDNDAIYWLEGRPQEQGRGVIVCHRDGQTQDLLPAPYSARSRVHEYGGAAFTVSNGRIWFVNDADQQIHEISDQGIRQLTNQPGCRFADLLVNLGHGCLYAIREDHRDEGQEPRNELVHIDLDSGQVTVINNPDGRTDTFAAAPALHPQATHLAWLGWQHPDMPWDQTTLWLAELDERGLPVKPEALHQQSGQAVFQPAWSPDGRLYFVNDPDGWWQLFRFNQPGDPSSLERLCDREVEMGLPLWQFGMHTYRFIDKDRILLCYCEQGLWRLARLCTNTGELQTLQTPWCDFSALQPLGERTVVLAAGMDRVSEVAVWDPKTSEAETLRRSAELGIGNEWFSVPEPVGFPTTDGDTAHGFFYPPHNPLFEAPAGERPPLLVVSHGGPTGATSAAVNLRIQFWTSRGFAVLDVNYRGSTGYGRAYRDRLQGQWGVYDVDDVVAGANWFTDQGRVDAQRLAIRGSSAGGFTTLAALTFRDTFRAGASFYGIGDLEALVRDTHKFEARYLDRLIGEYPAQQALYHQRSPLFHAEQLNCPVIFLQGSEDKVVPPAQAEAMVEALRQKGVPVVYRLFAGEQHGFRQADTIRQSLQEELAFYAQIFAFSPACDWASA